MATDVIQEKRQVHQLVDRLAPRQVSAVRGLLEAMLDPARAIANAPIDHQPLTSEEVTALQEAREWLKHNNAIPHEQVLAELGITLDEIDKFREQA